ncbi:MAG: serine/threonine-protein kinase [Candidatus Eremiobacteraeota bacterium]|nr:serine/threonine-protein kinase [Candidatus Eremiobacteraeota bacterium]
MDKSDIIAGKYKVVEVLGRGSYGTVFLVEELNSPGIKRALKVLDEARIPEEERSHVLELFRREAKLLADLCHPGIPSVTDFFSSGGLHHMVMEFIPGMDLAALKEARKGRLGCDEVHSWAIQLASILEYLHNQEPDPVIFRDLKPSNIMLSSSLYRIMLVDFGIARYFHPGKLKDTQFLGTPGFSPPEQYGSGQSDRRSDIYSFGATLYFMLTDEDIASFHFKLPPLGQLNSSVPPSLESIIMKCLPINPGERYQSMTEVLTELGMVEFSSHSSEFIQERSQERRALSTVLSKFFLGGFRDGILHYPFLSVDERKIGTFSTAEFSGILVNFIRITMNGVECHTVALVTLEGASFPKFFMRRESLLDIRLFCGDPDIDFKENPRFSKSFYLTGPDREGVKDFFRPEIIEAFAENPMKGLVKIGFLAVPGIDWIVEADGPHLIFYFPGIEFPKKFCQQFVEHAGKVLLPFVKKALQSRNTGG